MYVGYNKVSAKVAQPVILDPELVNLGYVGTS